MAAIVIADASPLIALARVKRLEWLKALFGQVLVTEEVMAKVVSGGHPARQEPFNPQHQMKNLRSVIAQTRSLRPRSWSRIHELLSAAPRADSLRISGALLNPVPCEDCLQS